MTRTPKQEILIEGLDDWVYEMWVAGAVWDITDETTRRPTAIGLIAELIVEGLMVPGSVDRSGHHPWDVPAGEAIERITRAWLTESGDDMPEIGSIVWLSNTEAGDRLAREVLAAENAG